MKSKVSVFSPAFNTPPERLQRSIDSIRAQKYPIWEILTARDGGPEDSWTAADALGVRVLDDHGGDNRGLAASCNTALTHATGEFLAKIDSDVEVAPFWLDAVMPHFRDDRVAGVGGRMVEVCQDSIAGRWRAAFMPQHWGGEAKTDAPGLFGADCIFRVEALRKVNGWNPRYRTNFEDMDLSKRLREAGYLLQYEPRALARHLRRDDLPSTLTNFWKWYKDSPEDAGMFDNMEAVAGKIAHNKELANQRLTQAVQTGELTLTYPCWLLFAWLCLSDLDYMARKHGTAVGATKLAIGRTALEWLRPLPRLVRYRAGCDLATFRMAESEEPVIEQYVEAFRAAEAEIAPGLAWMLETSVLALEAEE